MDWTNDTILRFLEIYQMHPCIWNPRNTSYKNKSKINEAWIHIQNSLGVPCTVIDLKKKKESLMSAYRSYKIKIRKSEETGDIYRPTWFAFDLMDSFLRFVYKSKQSMNTEDDQNILQVEDSNNAQYDTDDSNSIEFVASNPEQESPSDENTKPASAGLASSEQRPKERSRKRHHNSEYNNPSELQQTQTQLDQTLNVLKTLVQKQCRDEDDECDIFGKLIAKKLRTLPDDRRDLLMIQINELIYTERYSHNN